MHKSIVGALALSLGLAGGPALAQDGYGGLLDRALAMDESVDFAALRGAWVGTQGYMRTAAHLNPKARTMERALAAGELAAVIRAGEAALAFYPLDPISHLALAHALRESGDAETADRHAFMAAGLIRSILESGDGTTPETAFVVTGAREMEAVLRVSGLERLSDERVAGASGTVRRVQVRRRRDGATGTLHFRRM